MNKNEIDRQTAESIIFPYWNVNELKERLSEARATYNLSILECKYAFFNYFPIYPRIIFPYWNVNAAPPYNTSYSERV